tara:strand:+ start:333 stop:1094 length:762 start_codon:yes stop_codon:yes gene_type:complete
MNKTKTVKVPTIEKGWEIKDRNYYLIGNDTPIMHMIRSKNIFWFDSDKGHERELRATTNQKTPFVDEFKGNVGLMHIIFRDGGLYVPKNKQTLQKLLSLYHPQKGLTYDEVDNRAKAKDDLDIIEVQIDAMNAARELDVDHAEAVLRVEEGSKVSEMSSKEIKRDVLLFARKNPSLFLELAKDGNVELRNIGIKAVEASILTLSGDNRTFTWGTTKRKVLTVPFEEHPYSALAAFFKTDEGLEVYKNIQKRLK